MGMPISPLELDLFLDQRLAVGDHLGARTRVRRGSRSACSWRAHSTSLPRSVVPSCRWASSKHPGRGAGRPHRAQRPQLPRPLRGGGGAAADHRRAARSSDGQAGVAAVGVHPASMRWSRPLSAGSGDRARRLRLAAVGVVVWSVATFGSGLAPTLRRAAGRPRAGRRRRGQLRRRHALADLRPLPGRPPRPGPGHLLRGHPGGQRARLHAGRRRSGERYGWRTAFFVAGGPGLLLALSLLLLREPPRGRFDAARRRAAHGRSLGDVAALRCGAGPASWSTPPPRPSTPSPSAAWPSGCRPTSCASAASRWRRPRSCSGLCLVLAGFLGTHHRRPGRRPPGPAFARRPTSSSPAGRWWPRSPSRCWRCWPPSLLSSGRRCS